MPMYQPGDRIRLLSLPDGPAPTPPGSTGIVRVVRQCDSGRGAWLQVDADWDNGRKLLLSVAPGQVEVTSGSVSTRR